MGAWAPGDLGGSGLHRNRWRHGRSAWAPHSGQASLRFERLVISGSRGLTLDETQKLVGRYDLSLARPIESAPPEALIERFELQRSAARKVITDAIRDTAAVRVTREGLVPGSRFGNVHVSVLLQRLVTRRLAFPAWVLAYRYRGKAYRAIVHGHDARLVIGRSPISVLKVLLVIAMVLGGVALVALIAILIGVLLAAR